MDVSRADMTTTSPTSTYVLGSTNAEHERLIRQAAILDPFTERFFRDAGIGPAQRVLDIGSGLGDVTMLAARLVGPSGAVMGVDRDASIIAKAKTRVAEAGLHNVTFVQSDIGEIESSEPFDAIVGRFILEFVPDPRAVVCSLCKLLRPGCFGCPRCMLGPFSPVDVALTAPVKVRRFSHSPSLPRLRGEHEHGTHPIPDFPGGGAASATYAGGGSHRRRSRLCSMGLRYLVQRAAADAAARTFLRRGGRLRDAPTKAPSGSFGREDIWHLLMPRWRLVSKGRGRDAGLTV